MARIELFYAEGDVVDAPENHGFDPLKIHALLARLKKERGVDYQIVDAAQCSSVELNQAYEAAVKAAVWNRYPIRKVFGTNKSSASFFGRGVPAMLVYEGERTIQVYPHEGAEGKPVTIRDHLEKLVHGDQRGEALVSRMDALRKAMGPVGATTTELIREGRRR